MELDRIAFNSMPPVGRESKFLQILIALSEKEVLQSRRVYDSVEAFGDIGGILSVTILLGGIINMLVTGNEFAAQALSHYFSVDDDPKASNSNREADNDAQRQIMSSKPKKLGFCQLLLHGTVLRFLGCFALSNKEKRLCHLIQQTNERLARALDVRTILRTQSLLRTLTNVLLEKKHRPLLKL